MKGFSFSKFKFSTAFFVFCCFVLISLFVYAGTEAKFSLTPLTPTTFELKPADEATVQYQVTNNTKILRTLTMVPINGVIQDTTAGFCSSPFILAPHSSCLLNLHLFARQMSSHILGGPQICKTMGPNDNRPSPFLCSQPSYLDSLNVRVIPIPKTLLSIEINPQDGVVPAGGTLQFTATGTYADGSIEDITQLVTWTTASTDIASISNSPGSKGLALGVSHTGGSTIVSASLSNVVASTNLTVSAATLDSITISPANATIGQSTNQQFTAIGSYSDGTTQDLTSLVTWASSDTAVAIISNSTGTNGLASGVGGGTATITATLNGVSGNTNLTVTSATLTSIVVFPSTARIAATTTQAFTATGFFSDGRTQDLTTSVTWSASPASVATISNTPDTQGLATGVAPGGTATITATLGTVSGSATLYVSNATLTSIEIAPTDPTIAQGTTEQFTATGNFSDGTTQDITTLVTWNSTDSTVASISNNYNTKGVATGQPPGNGTSDITASFSGVFSDPSTITVTDATLTGFNITPTSASIAATTTQQFRAIGSFSNGSTQDLTSQVVWSSSNTSVATISNTSPTKGLATSTTFGGDTIISTSFGGFTDTANLHVTNATLVSIAVTPANQTIIAGAFITYTATGLFSDGTEQNISDIVIWSSTNQSVATISNAVDSKGVAAGLTQGTTNIQATYRSSITGQTQLTVSPATLISIALDPASVSIVAGRTATVDVLGTYSDGQTLPLTSGVTWTTGTSAVATISSSGGAGVVLGTAHNGGDTTMTATVSGVSPAGGSIHVDPAELLSIQIQPPSATINAGATQQFVAVGTYSDGVTNPMPVTWSSDNPSVATISATGLATADFPQTTASANIIATYPGYTIAPAPLTVTAYSLGGTITNSGDPATVSVAGLTLVNSQNNDTFVAQAGDTQFTFARGIPPNTNYNVTITAQPTNLFCEITNNSGVGTITNTNVTSITVDCNPILTSLMIIDGPTDGNVNSGATTPAYVAMGHFSDNTDAPVTSGVTWESSATNTAFFVDQSVGIATGGAFIATANITVQAIPLGSTTLIVSDPVALNVLAVVSGTVTNNSNPTISVAGLQLTNNTETITLVDGAAAYAFPTGIASGGSYAVSIAAQPSGLFCTLTGPDASSGPIVNSNIIINVSCDPVLTSIEITSGSLPPNNNINSGTSTPTPYIATGTYSDGTQQTPLAVTWLSDATGTASFADSSVGTATGGATIGTANITAQATPQGSSTPITSPSVPLNVLAVISGTITNTSTGPIPITGLQLVNNSETITFSGGEPGYAFPTGIASGNPYAVSVAAQPPGLYCSLIGPDPYTGNIGNSNITINVRCNAVLTSITIDGGSIPPNNNINSGTSTPTPYVATGHYSDGTNPVLTTGVTWLSDATGTASFADPNVGIATGGATIGTANITAQATPEGSSTPLISPSVPLNVLAVISGSITNTSVGPISIAGLQLINNSETITFTGGESGYAFQTGVASGNPYAVSVGAQPTGLYCSLIGPDPSSGNIANSNITVNVRCDAVLESILVSEGQSDVNSGATTAPFIATGHYTDNTDVVLTSGVTWLSSFSATASFADPSIGIATGGNDIGSVTISAQATPQGSTTPILSSNSLPLSVLAVISGSITNTSTGPTPTSIAGLQLMNNSETITFVGGETSYAFQTGVASGNPYAVSIVTQPTGLFCTLTGPDPSSGNIVNSNITVNVTCDALLTSITISGGQPSVNSGAVTTTPYTATGHYADGSNPILTSGVTWLSSPAATASFANPSVGIATGGTTIGTATITAQATPQGSSTPIISSNSLPLNVLAVISGSITNTSTGPTGPFTIAGLQLVNNGETITFTGGETSYAFQTGIASGNPYAVSIAAQPSQLYCFLNGPDGPSGFIGNSNITINVKCNAVLTSVTITAGSIPPNNNINSGTSTPTPYVATGHYSDGTNPVLTTGVTWLSDATGTASFADPNVGIATGGATIGTANITAQATPEGSSTPTNSASVPLNVLAVISGSITNTSTGPTPTSVAGLQLRNNTETITITGGQTSYSFPTGVASGNAYAVSIITQPTGLFCTLSGPVSGTITNSNINTVNVSCDPVFTSIYITNGQTSVKSGSVMTTPYTAMGRYSDGNDLPLTSGVSWSASPANRASFANSSVGLATGGTNIGTATITAQATPQGSSTPITSSPASLSVLAVISGSITNTSQGPLSIAGLQLRNNSETITMVDAQSSYSFPTGVASGNAYAVSVITQPSGLFCSLSSPSSGNIVNSNITVNVTCVAVLTRITITGGPPSPNNDVKSGSTTSATPYIATGYFSDNSPAQSPYTVTWVSSSTATAFFATPTSNSGVATGGTTIGATTITARATPQGSSTPITSDNSLTLNSLAVISGSVTNITNKTKPALTLTNNGGNTTTVSSAGTSYAFSVGLRTGTAYNVKFTGTMPNGLVCSLVNNPPQTVYGIGTVGATNVTVNIECVPNNLYLSTVDYVRVYSLVTNSGDLDDSTPELDNATATNPAGSAFTADRSRLYVTNSSSGQSALIYCNIDTSLGTITGGMSGCEPAGTIPGDAPYGVATYLTSTGTEYIYVSSADDDQVYRCGFAANNTLTGCISASTTTYSWDSPRFIAINPALTYAYITNNNSDELTYCQITRSTGRWTACDATSLSVVSPRGVAINEAGTTLYIADNPSSGPRLRACTINANGNINVASCEVATGVTGGDTYGGVAVTRANSYVYVPNQIGGGGVRGFAVGPDNALTFAGSRGFDRAIGLTVF